MGGWRRKSLIAVIVPVGLLLMLGQLVLVKAYRAPSESMEPTVKLGDRFVVWRLGYRPHVGDVAVFHAPFSAVSDGRCPGQVDRGMCVTQAKGEAGVDFVKRIVAGPGDRIRMEGGRLIRNGRPESGYRIRTCQGEGCDFPKEVTVPQGHWFVLGDNRGSSDDSRWWGPVPADAFVGKRVLTYWSG